jgi:tetratricopeptide (TPR) repeat protein/cell division septation protein DedD
MKHNITILTLLFSFCLSLQLVAQKNPLLQQADKEFDLHAYNLALKSYRKVIDKEPDNIAAYTGMADCFRMLGRMDESAEWYKRALQLPNVDPVTQFHYGQTLMALGEYEKALEWFLEYADVQPLYGNHYAESCRFALSLRGVPGLYRVKKEFINTDAGEFGPSFFKNQIVFSSSRTDLVRQMEKDNSSWDGGAKNQLYISGIDANGYLTKAQFLRSDLQNAYNEGSISYSEDGKWVAFSKNNFINGTRQIPAAGLEGSIYIAQSKDDGTWEDPKPFPHNGGGYSKIYPYLSSDGQKLYFASNRPDGYGGFDIYVSYRSGSVWTNPENLGPVVNSPGNELSPFMDNGVLYFASDWHHGLGGLDLFEAVTEDGLWSKVYHLGNTINSPYDDYGLIYKNNSNKGYFVSNRTGGEGNEDIYQFSKISEDASIVVTDRLSGKPLAGVMLDFTDCGSGVFPTDANGTYRFQVFEGLVCDVVLTRSGYKSARLKMDKQNKSNNTYTITLEGEPDLVTDAPIKDNPVKDNPIAGNPVSGLLFDSRNNLPVAGVVVTAQAKDSDQTLKTKSAANGNYQLDLQPNTSYLIRYSKMGYLNTHQKIETGATVDRDILGVLLLNASTTNLEDESEIVKAGPPKKSNENQPTNEKQASTSDNEAKGASATDSVEESAKEVPEQTGFAVQVAAIKIEDKVDQDKYKALSGIGNLYSRPEKGMQKVRVGIYRSREEAADARKSIVAKGFSAAFIVPESVANPDEIKVFDAAPVLEPDAAPKQKPLEKETSASDTKSDAKTDTKTDAKSDAKPVGSADIVPLGAKEAKGNFMVRLATYKKPEMFNDKSVSKLGKVEQRLSGEMTIMLLSGFTNLQEARDAAKAAIDLGFNGAHVVLEENGKLVKI